MVRRRQGVSGGVAFLLALAGGAAVGNLYWSQPILDTIAGEFGTTATRASVLVTVTQVGYAVGVFLVVPLGDIVDRKVMIPAFMLLSGGMLGISAAAPSFPVLLVTLALVGASTVSGQLLAPLAGDLATDEQRGRVIGTVVAIVSFVISGVAPGSIVAVVVSVALYSIGVQATQVLLQTRMMSLDPSGRSRLNTVFVVGNFVGGTIGSALAGLLWGLGGWPVIMTAAGVLLLLALLIWAVQRRRALAV